MACVVLDLEVCMIEVRALTKEVDGKRLPDGIGFQLVNGKIYGFLGPACETDLLLSLLAGVARPTEGSVRINGFDTVADEKKAKRCTAAFLSSSILCDSLSVQEFLLFAAQARGAQYEKSVRQVRKAEELCGLYELRERLIGRLTAEQRTRLCFAQTLVGGSEVLILAQPFSEWGDAPREELIFLLEEMAEGRTVLLSGTDRESLCQICDTLLTVKNGVLCSVEELTQEQREREPQALDEDEGGGDVE